MGDASSDRARSALTAPAAVPPGLLTTFAARYGMTVEEIAARLGLEADRVAAYDRGGGPGWLRLALLGIAVERGEAPRALTWLVDAPPTTPAEPAKPSHTPPTDSRAAEPSA